MKKNSVFFQKGLFEKPFMNSRITTASMTMKEKILGYLVGPFGILALVAIVNQLLELYYTEVFYIDEIFGAGSYLMMTWVTKAVGIAAGLLIAYVVERNVSSQGRIRPLVLIGCLLSAVSAFFLFYIPEMTDWARLAWVYVFSILFNGFGSSLLALRVNLLTQVGLNLLLWAWYFFDGPLAAMLRLALAELVVLVVEGTVYLRRLRIDESRGRVIAYTILANLASVVIGFLLLS